MMTRLGILGGTFNPIHIGHLVAAQRALERLRLDRVIFVPSYLPPHKSARSVIAAEERLALVRRALGGHDRFTVSDLEIRRQGRSYSIDTVKEIQQQYPDVSKMFFIIGRDALSTLDRWKAITELLQRVTFAVVDRPTRRVEGPVGIPFVSVPMPGLDIASSDIRRRIRAGKTVKYLLPETVLQEIEQKGLYRTRTTGRSRRRPEQNE